MNESKLQEIKKDALEKKIPIIMDDSLEVIEDILKKEKPTKILEIGTAVGYSAMCFAKFLNNSDESKVDTIEIEGGRCIEAKENIEAVGFKDKINVIHGDAVEILPTINELYDIVFIDAAKGKYLTFLEEAIRLVKKGGYIIADNVLYKGYVLSDYNKHKQRTAVTKLRKYLEISQENPHLETQILHVGDGLAISKKIN